MKNFTFGIYVAPAGDNKYAVCQCGFTKQIFSTPEEAEEYAEKLETQEALHNRYRAIA